MDTGGKGGNIEQTSKEIERLMGFRPDKYVIVNFDGIAASWMRSAAWIMTCRSI